jgi:hypothetical protein
MQEDEFYIVLTIEGTQFEEVEVTISNPLLTIREQIERIVEVFKLPKMDKGGNPVCYLLGREKEDGDIEIFDFEDTEGRECCLLDYNVYPGEHLGLITRAIAGGGGDYEWMDCIIIEGYDEESDSEINLELDSPAEDLTSDIIIPSTSSWDDDLPIVDWEVPIDQERLEQLDQEQKELKERERYERDLEQREREIREQYVREREEYERKRMEQHAKERMKEIEREQENNNREAKTFLMKTKQNEKSGAGRKLLERLNIIRQKVYASIFAPAEIRPLSHMLVQVYLHLYEETEKVKELAKEPQKGAERRDYISLQCKLKKGDKVDVLFTIYGKMLLMSEKKSLVWQGSFTKCSFDYFVPYSDEVNELSCVAMLSVNGIPVGEMSFVTCVVDSPRELNPEVISRNYQKVFISYSHEDVSKVMGFHEGLKLFKIEHFFDRDSLEIGAIFSLVIQEYINTADLFVLFWSENAAHSNYVQKEINQALERAYPQVQPEKDAKLRIYPLSIEPRAELPECMKPYYHFGEM